MLPYASQDGVKSMKCDGQKMKIWLLSENRSLNIANWKLTVFPSEILC
jgi:hypothetical protein